MGIATNLDITPAQRKQVCELISLYLPNTTVWAFGSRVKLTAKPSSDLDLVAFSTPGQKSNLVELREAFEESDLTFSVDILDWNSIPDSFKTNIRELYVVMVEQKDQQTKEGWKTYKLGDLIAINESAIGKSFQYKQIGYLDTSSVTQNTYDPLQLLDLNDAPSRAKRIVKDGDTIISTVRPIQKHFGFIKKIKPNTIVSTGFAVLTPKKIVPEFLYYFITQDNITNYLNGIAETSTTTFPAFRPDVLNDLEISLPDNQTQTIIASILSSFDDKIELNRQTNQTLEGIAQTLFQEMCVPKGEELPEGWRVGKLEDLIDTVSVTHKMKQEEIIFLNTSDILEGNVLNDSYSVVSTLPGQAKKSIERNDILFSEIRPANKRYAFVNFDADDYVVSTKLMVLRSRGEISPYLIYCYLTSNDTLNQLQHLAETRSGTFPQITFTQLKDLEIVIPTKEKLDKLTQNIESIYKTIFSNAKENQTLITLRDSLLPKLMKGEIEI